MPVGSVIVEQGETPASVWYVKEGTVLLTSVSAAGDETFCALRGPGSLLGLETLSGRATDYQAWALSDVVLCSLGTGPFESWLGDLDSPIGAVLKLALSEGSQRREERVALSGRSVARVARFLLERRRIEKRDEPLDVQHQILARMLGMRAETLSRAIGRLRDAKAIGPGRLVHVIDAARLSDLAGEEGAEE